MKGAIIFSELYESFLKYGKSKTLKQVDSYIMNLLKKDYTLLFPTFNLKFPNTRKTNYSIKNVTTSYLNKHIIKNYIIRRTSKPMYNFAVIGTRSKEILQLKQKTAWGEDSVLGYAVNQNFSAIGINIDYKKFNWLIVHHCEEKFKVPYRYFKKFSGINTKNRNKVFEKMYVKNLNKKKIYIENGKIINQRLDKKNKIRKFKFQNLKVSEFKMNEYLEEAKKLLKKNKYALVKLKLKKDMEKVPYWDS